VVVEVITKHYSNVLKDCPRIMYFNYYFFAGDYTYLKKWFCRGQERGFFDAGHSNRTIIGGRKWVEHYGEKVVKGGEGIVWCATFD
jgi:hypothetical protein